MIAARVKKGWYDAGRKLFVLGDPIRVNVQDWTPIVYDGEEDPTWIKTSAVELIPEPIPEQTKDNAFQWTDELVLMIVDLAHHNGYHRFNQKCVDLFDEVKKQAMGSGYQISGWVKNHLSKQSSHPSTPQEKKSEEKLWEEMQKNTDAFNKIMYPEKKLNQPIEGRDWEVLSLNYKGAISFWSSGRGYTMEELQKDGYKIHSVRRKDGIVFSVGDEIDHRESNESEWRNHPSKIISFKEVGYHVPQMIVEFMENNETSSTGSIARDLSNIQKLPSTNKQQKK